ncbi:Protein DMP8 [Cardamine amara subsp. amara]|uniref:Protein DMP8 n=1 Tax=Cardamine amara subsp. amara TaxID=228776 RepID=A0ABD1AF26_CARAN
MEKTEESVGIRVYTTATPPQKPSPPPSRSPKPVSISSLPSLPAGATAGGGRGRKRRIVAQGVQKTVSKTSMLVNFLPTGTLLMFEMVLPSIYRDGDCNGINTLMIHLLLLLCAMSCFFFHFTDSFKASDGKIYYGFVTPRGLAVFMRPPPPEFGGGDVIAEAEIPVSDERYKLRVNDFVHAVMSVLVFMAIAFSDRRVTGCLFPGKEKEMDQVMESFPLMVGIVCSALFLVFPTTRYGVGCMTA